MLRPCYIMLIYMGTGNDKKLKYANLMNHESGGFRFHFASRPCHILPRSRWYRLKSSWKLLILGWSDQKIYNGSLIWVSVLFLSFPPCHLHSMKRYLSLQASKQDTAWNTRWRRKVTALTLPWRLFLLFLPINSQALSIILLFLQSLCILSSSRCYVKCINCLGFSLGDKNTAITKQPMGCMRINSKTVWINYLSNTNKITSV